MKTKLLAIVFVVLTVRGYGQYDYFQWTKTLSYSTGSVPKSTGSGIAVDQFDRTFYIAHSPSTDRVYWQFGDLLGSSPNAAPATNIVYQSDNLGAYVYYINSNDRVGCTQYVNANSAWSHNSSYSITEPLAPGPSFAVENKNMIYYIRNSDKAVCNYWYNGSTSGFGPIHMSAPAAANLSNLVVNDHRIFYITHDNRIGCIKWDVIQNGWTVPTLINAPGPGAIAPGSKIQVSGNQSSFAVFFVAPDQNVYQYYYNPNSSGWGCISTGGVKAKIGTDILSFNDEVRYVGVDGNIQSLFASDCGWTNHTLNTSCSITDPIIAAGTFNKVFFYSNFDINYLSNISEFSGFVYRKGDRLMLNGQPFNSIGMNYMANMCSVDGGQTFFPSPHPHYANDWTNVPFNTQATALATFDQHLQEIANLGFNTIRFNDLHLFTDPNDPYNGTDLYFKYVNPTSSWNPIWVKLTQQNINALFQMYDYVLQRAAFYNLKVKFFIGLENGHRNTNVMPNYTSYLQQFANYFKNNQTIFSYAVLQEADINPRIHPTLPSYYRGKGDICFYVDNMYNNIRSVDPNHLVTLSVGGSGSLFSFDPYILNVDFLSFHQYPDPADNTYQVVRKEIQWISNIMKPLGKPWILGETGYPGSNCLPQPASTGSYQDQKDYADFILADAFSAGASGVSWWTYKDVFFPCIPPPNQPSQCTTDPCLTAIYSWINFWDNYGNYMGVKSHSGGLKAIVGGPGAVVTSNVFQEFNLQRGCSPLYPPANYYSANEGAVHTYFGTITNPSGDPLADAIILGMGPQEVVGTTFSQGNGAFSLQSSNIPSWVWIAAPGYIDYKGPMNSSIVLSPVVCGQGNPRIAVTDIKESSSAFNWAVYPNPSDAILTVQSAKPVSGSVVLTVSDCTGRTLLKRDYEGFNNETIDISAFANGLYFVEINTDDTNVVKKFVKK